MLQKKKKGEKKTKRGKRGHFSKLGTVFFLRKTRREDWKMQRKERWKEKTKEKGKDAK